MNDMTEKVVELSHCVFGTGDRDGLKIRQVKLEVAVDNIVKTMDKRDKNIKFLITSSIALFVANIGVITTLITLMALFKDKL